MLKRLFRDNEGETWTEGANAPYNETMQAIRPIFEKYSQEFQCRDVEAIMLDAVNMLAAELRVRKGIEAHKKRQIEDGKNSDDKRTEG